MIYPSADKIEKEIESKYALVVLAAKRARQVKEGAATLIDTESVNPLTIALEEIADGKLRYKFDETSLAGREALADKEAVVGARDIEVGNDPLAMPDDLLTQAAMQLGAEPSDLEGEDAELLLGGDDDDEDAMQAEDDELEESEE